MTLHRSVKPAVPNALGVFIVIGMVAFLIVGMGLSVASLLHEEPPATDTSIPSYKPLPEKQRCYEERIPEYPIVAAGVARYEAVYIVCNPDEVKVHLKPYDKCLLEWAYEGSYTDALLGYRPQVKRHIESGKMMCRDLLEFRTLVISDGNANLASDFGDVHTITGNLNVTGYVK